MVGPPSGFKSGGGFFNLNILAVAGYISVDGFFNKERRMNVF
jgi:hypothetical protein